MGAWGYRIFQSDATWDFLQAEVGRLVHIIDESLAAPSPDGFVDEPTFAAVACLHAYLRCIPEAAGEVPKALIGKWKAIIEPWMTESFDDLLNASEEQEQAVRAEINGMLDAMAELAKG